MYLSQLFLNPRLRQAQIDLADRYQLHRTVLSAFDPASLPDERILYRLETVQAVPMLIVQSETQPQWDQSAQINRAGYLRFAPAVKTYHPVFDREQTLRFRLFANPTVKRDRKRYALHQEEQQRAWLDRKALTHGFRVEAVQTRDVRRVAGRGTRMVWHQVGYEGVLTVMDSDAFTQAIRHGIGSAKAFGFGLLSVAPVSISTAG